MTNTLKQNLELRKALAEVDRLTSLNLELETENNDKIRELKDSLRKLKLQILNQVVMFQMGNQSSDEMARVIKEILK